MEDYQYSRKLGKENTREDMDKVGIGDVAVLLTAIGTTTYIMGLLAVAWPIYAKITPDAPTTWRAVVLIPKTVVAAQGVGILFSLPFLVTILTILLSSVLVFFYALIDALFPPTIRMIIILVSLVAILLRSNKGVVWIISRPSISWLIPRGTGSPARSALTYTALILGHLVAGIAGLLWFLKALIVEWEGEGIIPQVTVHGNWVFLVAVLIFTSQAILSLPIVATINPPLPRIEIVRSDQPEILKGRLIAHVDGFWHFFTEGDVLASLPDDKVTMVNIIGPESVWVAS